MLANLLGLLLGFALLSQALRASTCRRSCPILPDDWKGGFVLLVDRVRAVELPRQHRRGADRRHDGGAVFRGRVHIGYLAAIVAASNAGGSGSVVGDTTTTMMWIDGVSPLEVLHANRGRASRSSCSASRPPSSSSASADRQPRYARVPRRLGARGIVVVDPGRSPSSPMSREPRVPGRARTRSRSSALAVWVAHLVGRTAAAARLGVLPARSRARLPAGARALRLDDARRAAAGRRRGRRRSGSASSRRYSTTSR